jgi:hypothetical protein
MKRTLIAAMVILLAAGVTYFAYAADPMMKGKGMMDGNDMMMQKGMMGQGMMGKTMPMMCPMHTMMCQGMMKKEIVATSDGGVIVMADNKLFKYDKDVNLIKEVELKIDMKAMQDKMMQMMKDCPMCKNMMTMQDKSGSM